MAQKLTAADIANQAARDKLHVKDELGISNAENILIDALSTKRVTNKEIAAATPFETPKVQRVSTPEPIPAPMELTPETAIVKGGRTPEEQAHIKKYTDNEVDDPVDMSPEEQQINRQILDKQAAEDTKFNESTVDKNFDYLEGYAPHQSAAAPTSPEAIEFDKMTSVIPTLDTATPIQTDSRRAMGKWESYWENTSTLGWIKEGILDLSESPQSLQDRTDLHTQRVHILRGVQPSFHDEIMAQPNVAAATRKADAARKKANDDLARNNMSGVGYLSAEIGNYLLDPTNIFVAAKAVTGVRAGAALMGFATTGTRATATQLSIAAGIEELVRNQPRLHADVTYDVNQYLTEAAIGMAFGAAMPLGITGAKIGLKKGAPALSNMIGDAARRFQVDTAAKRLGYTAQQIARQVGDPKVTGTFNKMRAANPVKAFNDAKVRANQSVAHSLREYDKGDIIPTIKAAVEAGDAEAIAAKGAENLKHVAAQLSKTGDSKAVQEVLDQINVVPVLKPVGDTAPDIIEVAAKDAQKAYSDVVKLLSDENISKIYGGKVPEAATQMVKRLRSMNEVHGKHIKDSIDHVKEMKGHPVRKPKDTPDVVATKVARAVDSLHKVQGKSTIFTAAMRSAGIQLGDGETVTQALQRVLKYASRTEQIRIVGKINDSVDRLSRRTMDDIDLDPNFSKLSPEEQVVIRDRLYDEHLQVSETTAVLGRLAEMGLDSTAQPNVFKETAQSFLEGIDAEEIFKQYTESLTQRGIKNVYGKMSESLNTQLISSKQSIATWFAMNILESPSGYGGVYARTKPTAPIMANIWDNQSNRVVDKAYHDMLDEIAALKGWGSIRTFVLKNANARTDKDADAIGREMMMEINNRNLGKPSTASAPVKKFINTHSEQTARLHDRQLKHGIEGITANNKITDYSRQTWRDDVFSQYFNDPTIGADGLRKLFAKGYQGAGLDPQKAKLLADAIVDLKKASMNKAGGRVYSVGHEIQDNAMGKLTEVLAVLGKSDKDPLVKELIEDLTKPTGGLPGYTQHRMMIDYSANTQIGDRSISILDLLDSDVPGSFGRYAKEANGRSAISHASAPDGSNIGILNSDKAYNDMLIAMSDEAVENGAKVNTQHVKDAFGQMLGTTYSGQLPLNARRARDAVALAGMGGLGESQLAEFGLAINRGTSGLVGLMQVASHRNAVGKQRRAGRGARFKGIELTPEQMRNPDLLDEMQQLSGLYEDMYILKRWNVHYDQQAGAENGMTSALDKAVDFATGGKYQPMLKAAQTRYTGYGVIRTWEEQITMAALMQDINKMFTGGKASMVTSVDRLKDIGILDNKGNSFLEKKFKDGTITLDSKGRVEALNINQWSIDEQQQLGAALTRYASQQVQQGFVGELSPLMARPDVSFLMQFKQYPMLAHEKQLARHAKFADKEAALGMGLNSISSAASRVVRVYSLAMALPENERDAYIEEHIEGAKIAQGAWKYSAFGGMFPELAEYAAIMGFDNPLATGTADSFTDMIPAINYADSYVEALKSTGKLLPGQEMTTTDINNIQQAAPLGTISYMNMMFGLLKDASE